MSPRRSTVAPDPENQFEEAFINQQQFVAVVPVENAAFINITGSLEATGLSMMGAGQIKAARFAEIMHRVYTQVADIEIAPPLDEAQLALVAGKVATYAALQEVAESKSRAKSKPTDPSAIATDKSKS